jgi:hypothetical protein
MPACRWLDGGKKDLTPAQGIPAQRSHAARILRFSIIILIYELSWKFG